MSEDLAQPGDRLGPWTLIERVGVGGLAEVWSATTSPEERPMALKVLRDPNRSRAHRARFLREGRLLRRLNHPGLPRCFDVVEVPRPYLVLELLTGGTLSQHVKAEGTLQPAQVMAVANALLRVLDYLHHHGIVHRDVKSSNVYMDDSRRVLLLDLGLAADPTDPLTTTLGDVMGTYAYMAPEQIAGAEVDHRCDLYSLGVTLYESLVGSRPFHASGAAGYLRAHRSGHTTPLSQLVPDAPVRLLDTVTRLMARDPAARPPSAGIAHALLMGGREADRRLSPAPLVGRAAAMGAIQAALDGAGALLLRGEIGSGLGRMASQALTIAREEEVEVLAIRCRDRAPPLDPIEQLGRDLRRISGPVPLTPSGLGKALEALSGEGPTMLLIEDTERMSQSAASMLSAALHLAPQVALVMTGLRAPPGFEPHQVELRPLSAAESHRVVSGMLGTPTPPAGLSEQLHQMSSGLPAVVVLGIKELVARCALTCVGISDSGVLRWHLDRTVALEPTTGLHHLFGKVLHRLEPDARGLLEVLAVGGEALPMDVALDLSGLMEGEEGYGSLIRAGLIRTEAHHDGDWITLRRPAVGALVLEEMSPNDQSGIHRELAQALGAMPPSGWRDNRMRWHSAFGATSEEAPQALLSLGEQLFSQGSHGQALEVLDRASRIPGVDTRLSAQLAIARGEVLDAVARREEAATALSAGRRLANELGSTSLEARAMVALAQVHHGLGDERRAALLSEEVLDLLGPTPEDPSLPRALLLAATSHRLGARPEEAARFFQRCIEVSKAQGRPSFEARAHGGLGALLAEEGQLSDAIDHFNDEASYLRAEGSTHELVPTLYRMCVCERRLGHPDSALAALDEAEDIARFAHLPYARALARIGRANVSLACGAHEIAAQYLDSARIALDPEASTFLRLAFRESQAWLRLMRGDRQASLAAYQAAEMEAARAGFAAAAAFYLGMVGVLTADPEALSEAMRVLGQAGDRGLAARLLYHGATVGGDAEVLESTERETRASGDRFLLLDVLFASRGSRARTEARHIVDSILERTPEFLREYLLAVPAVRWARSQGDEY